MKMTVSQYAESEGITRQAALARIKAGTVKASKQEHSGIWIITDESIEKGAAL